MSLKSKRLQNVSSISSAEESNYSSSSEESDTGCYNKQKLSIYPAQNRHSAYNNNILSKNNENFQNFKMVNSLKNISQHRKNRCNSKNAINARENRLKKKLYIENLEKSVEKYRCKNKQLSLLLETQTNLLNDMRKEVQYFKSIVANNRDISRLLRCINQNTGLPITTSINKGLSMPNKGEIPVGQLLGLPRENSDKSVSNKQFFIPEIEKPVEKHPWEDSNLNLNDGEFYNYEIPDLAFTNDDYSIFEESMPTEIFEDNSPFPKEVSFLNEEHNYTALSPESLISEDLIGDSPLGICLHISNHKLSLEFCSTCSENASTAWKS